MFVLFCRLFALISDYVIGDIFDFFIILETTVGSQKSAQALRVRHEITRTIGPDDFGASQGAKSAHTGSMEAISDAGGAQKRPALRGGPSLARGVVAPQAHIAPLGSLVAPRPDHKSGPPNYTGYFVTGPNIRILTCKHS